MILPQSKDRFALWLAAVSLAVVATAGATAGIAILRSNSQDTPPVVLSVSLAERPEPELLIETPPEPEAVQPPETLPEPEPELEPEPEVIPKPEPEIVPEPEIAPPAPTPKPVIEKRPAPTVESRPPAPRAKPAPKKPKVEAKPKPRPAVSRNLSRGAGVVRRVNPTYPRSALKSKASGTVYVTVTINTRGKVESSTISQSSGHSSLDKEALRTIRRWRFSPALSASGTPIRSNVRVPVQFQAPSS